MPNAAGLFKQVAFKREVAFGTIPAATGPFAQLLRRVQSSLDLAKDVYQSNEIRPDLQVADMRHGVRRIKGSLQGELSPGTYADLFAIAMKRDFTAGVSTSGASITIAAGTGTQWTVTRAAGSYLTDGFKIGDVIRLSAGTFNAANLNKNLFIIGLTATVATVVVLNASPMVAEGPITAATVAVQGKKTYVPTSGHTDNSFSIEHWFNDVAQSEVFSGCKVDKIALSLPPTGMATAQIDIIGQGITPAQARYFTTPLAVTTTGDLAAVNGVLLVNGAPIVTVTGLTLSIDPAFTDAPVVGSNVVPTIFPGPVMVSGQLTAYFTDNVLRDLFVNETESSLAVALTSDNTATSQVLALTIPRLKFSGASKSDGTGGIVQTLPFTALLNVNGGAGTVGEQTTITVQDTAA